MASTGRRLSPVWIHFKKVKLPFAKCEKAKCDDCGELISCNVDRLIRHREEKHRTVDNFENNLSSESMQNGKNENAPHVISVETTTSTIMNSLASGPSLSRKRQGVLGEYPMIIKTSKVEKQKMDSQCARFIYATNSAFTLPEHPEFVKFCQDLRPGYIPPKRDQISGSLLDLEFKSLINQMKNELHDKIVCLSIDGWSNLHNEPIVCICATDPETSEVYLIDTINTTGKPHTSEYLAELTTMSILKCKNEFGCIVGGVVTDNANNMKAMRNKLGFSEHVEVRQVFSYGCSAHLANLFCKDIRDDEITEKVKTVHKYFRNHHEPKAQYVARKGKQLELPCDTRWNSIKDCFASFIENYTILTEIANAYKRVYDSKVINLILEENLIAAVQPMMEKLNKIGTSLDNLQADSCYLSDAYEIWYDMYEFFEKNNNDDDITNVNTDHLSFKERYKVAISEAHILANMLDPRFRGKKVSEEHRKEGMEFLKRENVNFVAELVKFNAQSGLYLPELFEPAVVESTNPYIWWKSLKVVEVENEISKNFIIFCMQLFSCTASSAGIERLFSTFGFVHSKVRNRLGIVKCGKLVTIFKALNSEECRAKKKIKKSKKSVNSENQNAEEAYDEFDEVFIVDELEQISN